MPYKFTIPEKKGLHRQKEGQWSKCSVVNTQFRLKTISNIPIKLYKDTEEKPKHAKVKEKILTQAIKGLQSSQIMFQPKDIEEFMVFLYNKGPSRGVVFFETTVSAKPIIVLMLGNRFTEHIKAGSADDTAGGSTLSPPRIVADRVYDYYKPTRTVSAKEKSAIAHTYHEFGHIFHQLLSANNYNINAEVAAGRLETTATRTLLQTVQTTGKKYVSQVAGKGKTCMNEYVAEVFSGIMMKVDWDYIDKKVLRVYNKLGGPLPNSPGTMSRMAQLKTQNCQCPGAGVGGYGHGMKIFLWN